MGRLTNKQMTNTQDETEKCFLEFVEGHKTCTFNHTAGALCLMNKCDACHKIECLCYQDNTQETWREEVAYIMTQSSPAGCQYSDSRYSNQMTVDVLKKLFAKEIEQAIIRTRLEVREEIKKYRQQNSDEHLITAGRCQGSREILSIIKQGK